MRPAVLWPLALLLTAGCAHAPRGTPGSNAAPGIVPDSVTAALWHMDETGGKEVTDSGPYRIDGQAGIDTRTDFGRVRGARLFTRSLDSFAYAPYHRALDSGLGATVEAWIFLNAYGQFEDTPIAGRWTQQANEQSWMFSVLGLNLQTPVASRRSPGYHDALISQATTGTRGRLMFVFQPEEPSPPRAYFSTRGIPLQKWTHVAATFDGEVVGLWIDGELDGQFAARGRIRPSPAGLVVGNYLDPRWLSDFSGDLRITTSPDRNPYYAFEGFIDELRVSTAARGEFPYARGVTGGRK